MAPYRDLLAARRKKSRRQPSCVSTSSASYDPCERPDSPPTTSVDNDLYRDIFSDDHTVPDHAEGSSSPSPTLPPISNDSFDEAMI